MADKSGRRLLLIVSLNFSIMFNIMWLFAWRMRNRMTKSSIALQVSASGMAFSLLVVAISFYVKVIIYWYVLFCCYIHIIHCFIISMYVSAHVCGYHSLSEQYATCSLCFFLKFDPRLVYQKFLPCMGYWAPCRWLELWYANTFKFIIQIQCFWLLVS